MIETTLNIPVPVNEKVLSYAPDTPERALLTVELEEQYRRELDIPLIIGGREIRTGNTADSVCPHNHSHVLAHFHKAGEKEIHMAIDAALNARLYWQSLPWTERAAIFLKAADLIAGKYRMVLNAATMLNQGKNPYQAEIDAACELADFLRLMSITCSKSTTSNPSTMTPEHGTGWNTVPWKVLFLPLPRLISPPLPGTSPPRLP